MYHVKQLREVPLNPELYCINCLMMHELWLITPSLFNWLHKGKLTCTSTESSVIKDLKKKKRNNNNSNKHTKRGMVTTSSIISLPQWTPVPLCCNTLRGHKRPISQHKRTWKSITWILSRDMTAMPKSILSAHYFLYSCIVNCTIDKWYSHLAGLI